MSIIYLLAGDSNGILFDSIEDACESLIKYAACACEHPISKYSGWLGLFKIYAFEDSADPYDMNGSEVEIEWDNGSGYHYYGLRAIKDEDYDECHDEDDALMRIELSKDEYDIDRICES